MHPHKLKKAIRRPRGHRSGQRTGRHRVELTEKTMWQALPARNKTRARETHASRCGDTYRVIRSFEVMHLRDVCPARNDEETNTKIETEFVVAAPEHHNGAPRIIVLRGIHIPPTG